VEHSVAVMDSVSYPMVVVMGLANALMVVMRLDVVSYNSIQGGGGDSRGSVNPPFRPKCLTNIT